jgi:hypothetical protein
MFTKSINEVQPMTIEAASDYARQLVEMEARGPGDTEGAMFRLEQRYGIGTNQLLHLRAGRAKSCDVSLFARLRMAYLDLCASKVRTLQHKIAIEEATGDDTNSDLAYRLHAIAAEIEAKKAGVNRA